MLDRLLAIELIEADNNPPLSGGLPTFICMSMHPRGNTQLGIWSGSFHKSNHILCKICPSIVRFLSGLTHCPQEVRVS